MTSPVPDALRTQLAEVLAEKKSGYLRTVDGRVWVYLADPAGIADALMPVVETALARARAEGAAEALREAAKHLDPPPLQWPVNGSGGHTVAQWLLARAAALSAPTTTEGDPT